MPPADILENARDRGSELDKLAAAYVRGELKKIPAGTREDAKELFLKFRAWFGAQNFSKVEAQVVLGGEDYGGVLDFRFDGTPCDLKGTYNIEQTAVMQVSAYTDLCKEEVGGILQVTERLKAPVWRQITEEDMLDWRIMLSHWRMLQRRQPPR